MMWKGLVAGALHLFGVTPSWSHGIHEGVTAGYGSLDDYGFWEYPLIVIEERPASSCFFYQMDRCVMRNLLTKTTEDCEFVGKDGSCNAKESDLSDYDEYLCLEPTKITEETP